MEKKDETFCVCVSVPEQSGGHTQTLGVRLWWLSCGGLSVRKRGGLFPNPEGGKKKKKRDSKNRAREKFQCLLIVFSSPL